MIQTEIRIQYNGPDYAGERQTQNFTGLNQAQRARIRLQQTRQLKTKTSPTIIIHRPDR